MLDGDAFIVDKQQIAQLYLRSWFAIDVLSSLPIELIDFLLETFFLHGSESASPNGLRLLRALRLFRLLRMLRLLKLLKLDLYLEMVSDAFAYSTHVLQILKMLLGSMYCMHVLGCFWYYLASGTDHAGPTWLREYRDGEFNDAPLEVQYLYSIYWALMVLTTVGYGDILPTNVPETVYVMLSLLIGALAFGVIVSTMRETMRNSDRNATMVAAKLNEVDGLLRWHHVPRKLKRQINRFFEFYYARRLPMNEEEVLETLPPSLARELRVHLLGRTVGRIPMLTLGDHFGAQFGVDLQLKAYVMLKPIVREAKELVRGRHDESHSIFFVSKGKLLVQMILAKHGILKLILI